jgi:hypothetical protein
MKCDAAIPECDLVNYLRSVTAKLFKGGATHLIRPLWYYTLASP